MSIIQLMPSVDVYVYVYGNQKGFKYKCTLISDLQIECHERNWGVVVCMSMNISMLYFDIYDFFIISFNNFTIGCACTV